MASLAILLNCYWQGCGNESAWSLGFRVQRRFTKFFLEDLKNMGERLNMRQTIRFVTAAGLLAIVNAASADTILRQQVFDLSQAGNPAAFKLRNTAVQAIDTDDEGFTRARLSFAGYRSSFGRESTTYYEDWSPYNLVCIKLTNRESRPIEFRLIVNLTSNPENYSNGFNGGLRLAPYETRRFICALNPDDPSPFGLEYLRPVLSAETTNIYAGTAFRNLRTIYHWRMSLQNDYPANVDVSDFRLIKQDLTFSGMVDAFGQYTDRTWANKVYSESDLLARKSEELTDLAANPSLGETYGTVRILNDAPVYGRWRTVTLASGNKYLQHPNGNLFWSLGVSAVHGGMATPVEGREHYFQSLPGSESSLSSLYSSLNTPDGVKRSYSFHEQNLRLKYGADYQTPWLATVKQRLDSWGLNTLGMQCSSALLDNSMPYTPILSTAAFPTRFKVPYSIWGTLPDPFAAGFRTWMINDFTNRLSWHSGRVNYMGVYVDNEMGWGNTSTESRRWNLALGALKSSSTQPAKIALIKQLKSKYGTIGALNTAWNTSFSSFEALQSAGYAPSTFTPAQSADFAQYCYSFAMRYFWQVRSALSAAGSTGLYLGCRFADNTPEVVNAAGSCVDVYTFNMYRTWDKVNWDYLNSLPRPVLISELGYSVQGAGTFGGPAEVSSQTEKAANVAAFLRKAHVQPNIVGVILYCYTDQPITGRYTDYENSGLGLVDVTDTPHYETVNVLRQFSREMYVTRN